MSPLDNDSVSSARFELEAGGFSEIADAMSDLLALVDDRGQIRYLNQAGRRLLGYSPELGLSCPLMEGFQPAELMPAVMAKGKHRQPGQPWQVYTVLRHKDGHAIHASVLIVPQKVNAEGESLYWLLARTRDKPEDQEFQSNLFRQALDFDEEPIVIIDRCQSDHPIIYANPAFEAVTGCTSGALIGSNAASVLGKGQSQPEMTDICNVLSHERGGRANLRMELQDGQQLWRELAVFPIFDQDGQTTHCIGVLNDVTARRKAEERLEFLASHDALCGMPDRALLLDLLSQALGHKDDADRFLGIVYIGVDRLKSLNESLGYAIGDAVVKETATRLQASLPEHGMIARVDSDEFAIILDDLTDVAAIEAIAALLQKQFARPFEVGPTPRFVSSSIGIAIYPIDGNAPEILLQNAAIAMRRAKAEGGNTLRFFAHEIDIAASRHGQLEHDLRIAFERGEFSVVYQPQMDLGSGRVTGVESLLRWQHPELGWISPAEFIPAAEVSGLIVPLGEWVLREACKQAAAWQRPGSSPVVVAVNLSAHQFRQPELVDTISSILSETGLDARCLELELTETSLMSNAEEVSTALFRLRELGLQLSVDDFGTGYSSLSYLRRFPLTKVKIDRSFITNVTTQPEDAAVTRAIISMCHGLKLKVIAEGVETEVQKAFLLRHGCDAIQGYLLSPPVPAEECLDVMRALGAARHEPETASEQAPALLLVDDEPSLLRALWRTLRLDGYRVLMANSAREALDMLALDEVGVIVSDQRMPEMTGVEFLRRVKELYPKTIRIVLSGYTELDSVTSAINEGAIYKFLTKPWEDEQLRENISEAFRRFRMEKENLRLTDELRNANAALSRLNKSLELQVAEKVQEIAHNIGMLQVSQEILESLPIAIVGVDEHGMIAFSNRQADNLFQGALLGESVHTRLPDCIQAALHDCGLTNADLVDGGLARLQDGREFQVWLHAMGESSRSKGVIIVFLPVKGL